jgi:hypothetical protein
MVGYIDHCPAAFKAPEKWTAPSPRFQARLAMTSHHHRHTSRPLSPFWHQQSGPHCRPWHPNDAYPGHRLGHDSGQFSGSDASAAYSLAGAEAAHPLADDDGPVGAPDGHPCPSGKVLAQTLHCAMDSNSSTTASMLGRAIPPPRACDSSFLRMASIAAMDFSSPSYRLRSCSSTAFVWKKCAALGLWQGLRRLCPLNPPSDSVCLRARP